MADLFAKEGISVQAPETYGPPVHKDIFASEGIQAPSIKEQNTNALTSSVNLDDPKGPDEEFIAKSANQQKSDIDVLAKSRFTPEQIDSFKKNPITFSQAGKFLNYKNTLPGGGIYQGIETFEMLGAANKLKKGEELSVEEQDVLNKNIDQSLEMSLRGFSIGGGIAYYGSQMPAFMTEFIATGGVGKLAEKAVAKVAEKAAIKGLAAKAAEVTANVGARAAVMPQLYVPRYAERRLNDFTAVTDKGDLVLKQADESPAKSALMAFAYTSTDVASEMSGGAIGKYIIEPIAGIATKALKTPLVSAVNNLSPVLKDALYQAYKVTRPAAQVSQVFTAAGWNGMLEELGENRVQDVMNGVLGLAGEKDYTYDDFIKNITPSPDQLMIEGGIIAIAGGVKTSADISLNLLRSQGIPASEAKKMVDNMSANEQEQFVAQNLPAPISTFPEATPTRPTTTQELDEGISPSPVNFEADVVKGQISSVEQSEPPPINNDESVFNEAYRLLVNDLVPIDNLTKEAQARGANIPDAANPQLLASEYAQIVEVIRQNLQVGTTIRGEDGNMVVTGKSLKAIRDDFDNYFMAKEPSKEQREQDFNDYQIAQRYGELKEREDVLVTEKQLLKAATDLANLARKYGDDFHFFETFAQEERDFRGRIYDNLVRSGLVSKEQAKATKEANQKYVSFARIMEEEEFAQVISRNSLFKDPNPNKVVKKIEGSQKEIKNVLHSDIKNTARILDVVARNDLLNSMAKLSSVMPDYVRVDTERADDKDASQSIPFYQDGERKYLIVSKPIFEAFNQLSPAKISLIERILTTPLKLTATALRTGATLIPEFVVRNILRDQQTAILQGGVKYTPIRFFQGLLAVTGLDNDSYNAWARSGGKFGSYMALDDKGIEKAYKELFSNKGKLSRYLNPLNILGDISAGGEQATRVGLFKAAKDQGHSDIMAAYLSREGTLNFARGGKLTKWANQYIPFLNAGVQGTDKMARTFKNNPGAVTFWGISTITVPSLLIAGYYLYGASKEDRDEYLEIPQWQRDMFWVFKQNGEWRRYPKPFSYGFIFGSVPERLMLAGFQGDKPQTGELWKGLALGLAGSVSPVYDASAILPPLVKVAIEDVTNYSFFTGRSIYPDWMDRLDPELQYNKHTTDTAKFLGKELKHSPAKIDNALRDTLGGSADYITDAGDAILRQVKEWNGKTSPDAPVTDSDVALIKAFSVRRPSGYKSNSAANFFDNWNEVQAKHASADKLEGDEGKEYAQKNAAVISQYRYMKSSYEEMRGIQKQADAVADLSISNNEKIKRINALEDKITDIARTANKAYAKAVQNGTGGAP